MPPKPQIPMQGLILLLAQNNYIHQWPTRIKQNSIHRNLKKLSEPKSSLMLRVFQLLILYQLPYNNLFAIK